MGIRDQADFQYVLSIPYVSIKIDMLGDILHFWTCYVHFEALPRYNYNITKIVIVKIHLINTAIIPVAGLGTRMLPFTKEEPKAMLPLFAGNTIKPTVQIIFEQLYAANIRKFVFIVDKGKRIIEDHFTPDYTFLDSLKSKGKNRYIVELFEFYKKIEASSVVWINQSRPMGLGHSILLARACVKNDQFLVHAGDTILTAPHIIKRMLQECNNYPDKNASCICVRKIDDKRLLRRYGVANVNAKSHVTKLVEKPAYPKSNFAVIPIYVLGQSIFDRIKISPHGKSNEVQLTNAINNLIKSKQTVLAYLLKEDVQRIDVGSPDTYFDALSSWINIV